MAQSQKPVIKLNKALGFQTGLPAFLSVVIKCQRTLNEIIRNIVFSSV